MTALKKASARQDLEVERGLWWPLGAPGGGRTAMISCPGCGESHLLDPKVWSIAVDGTVTPSVDHSTAIPRTGGLPPMPSYCQFHDNVRLDGWARQ